MFRVLDCALRCGGQALGFTVVRASRVSGVAHQSNSTSTLLARTFFPLSLAAEDGARMAQAELVSGNYFETLRVTPFVGRFFDDGSDRGGGGWIAAAWGTSENNRRANFYSLTRRGQKLLETETVNWQKLSAVMGRVLASDGGESR